MLGLGVVLTVSLWGASEHDVAIVRIMRRLGQAEVKDQRLMRRVHVNEQLDLIVAVGKVTAVSVDPPSWAGAESTLGLFLQSRSDAGLIYKLTIEAGRPDCEESIELASTTEVILSCRREKVGVGPNRAYIVDARSKELTRRFDYEPFAMQASFASGKERVLAGSNTLQPVAVSYGAPGGFRVLSATEMEKFLPRLRSASDMQRLPRTLPNGFALEVNSAPGELPFSNTFVDGDKVYALPQSSYETFAKLRASRAAGGYSKEKKAISEAFGPVQSDGKLFWFGKTFYDGEGMAGVGGAGWFDTETREYKIYSPREIADYSTTALLVEKDAVWLGLTTRSEWGEIGAGLLRLDRKTETTQKFPLHDVIGDISRVGKSLLLATESGMAVLEEGRLRRYLVDVAADGKLHVVEAAAQNSAPAASRTR